MKGFCTVSVGGNLGRDPEHRTTNSGMSICNLSIAEDAGYKEKSGKVVERTEWHKCVLFGYLADLARDYLKNGGQVVLVGGRNRTQSWQDGEITRYSTEIVFNPRDGATINLISDKRQDAPVSIAPAAQQPEQSTGQPVAQSVPPIIQNMEVLDFDDMDYDAMFDHNPAQ